MKNRLALSTVVTSLIILVISVLLASVVSYFAINVVSTRSHDESLQLKKMHVWCPGDPTITAEAAFLVVNTGGRDVVITKITVRGQTVSIPPSGTKAVCYATTNKAITQDLSYIAAVETGGDMVPIDSSPADDVRLVQATSSITLGSGQSLVVYISSPDSVTVGDCGLTVSITVFTSQSMYYQESNVQSYSDTPGAGATPTPAPAPSIAVSYPHAWYDGIGSQVDMVITNTGTSQVRISTANVNGQDAEGVRDYVGTFTVTTDLPYIDGSYTVGGHHLNLVSEIDIPIGQTAIICFLPTYSIDQPSAVGTQATVNIMIIGSSPNVQHLTVEDGS